MQYDLLVYNANLYSLEDPNARYNAMLVKDGMVAALSSDNFSQLDLAEKEITALLDAKGFTVLPAFVDSHVHFFLSCLFHQIGIDVSHCTNGKQIPLTMEEIKKEFTDIVNSKSNKKPLIFYNYPIHSLKEKRLPTKDELNQWLNGRSACVISTDGLSSSCTQDILDALDLLSPTGILSGNGHETNLGKIMALLSRRISLPQLYRGIIDTLNEAISHGVGTLIAYDGIEDDPKDISPSAAQLASKLSPLVIRQSIQNLNTNLTEEKYAPLMQNKRVGGSGSWLMNSLSTSAGLTFADHDKESITCQHTTEALTAHLQQAHEKGYQISVCAKGEKAVADVVASFRSVMKDSGNPLRHRIEQFIAPSEESIEAAVKANLLICVQPSTIEAHTSETQSNQPPYRELYENGVCLLSSSGAPFQPINPFLQIHCMVNNPEHAQRLTVYQALKTCTANPACALFTEEEQGMLSLGMKADFLIADKDPFAIQPNQLKSIQVQSLYLNGSPVQKLKPGLFKTAALSLKKAQI